MPKYAADTSVPAEKSRAEIERTLQRYGATAFGYGWTHEAAVVEFAMDRRRVRFRLPMPDPAAAEFTLTPTGKERSESAAREAWEQATRQRWRALNLVVKAKLEAVDAEIATFEEEFLAFIVLPSGRTVAETAIPAIAQAYETGKVPELMPGS